MSRYIALIPAAGNGSRMASDRPKQYLEVGGRPLLWYTLQSFCSHPAIAQVVVVTAAEDRYFGAHDWSTFADKLLPLAVGGATRGESVRNGLAALRGQVADEDWILVHDAARPGIDHELIDRLLSTLADDPVGGILALPVADTVKLGDGSDRIAETRSREGLWQAQTPQMFPYRLLVQALADSNPATVTDEASAVEALGLRPKLVRGAVHNWKVTYAEDLRWVASCLLER